MRVGVARLDAAFGVRQFFTVIEFVVTVPGAFGKEFLKGVNVRANSAARMIEPRDEALIEKTRRCVERAVQRVREFLQHVGPW